MPQGYYDGANGDRTNQSYNSYYVPASAQYGQYPSGSLLLSPLRLQTACEHNRANDKPSQGAPSSTSESTYPTSNLGTPRPANYIPPPGMGTAPRYAATTHAASQSGYINPGSPAPGSNSSVVYLTSPNSQSISQGVVTSPNTMSVSSVPQTYPVNRSAYRPSYNTPQSSQGSVSSTSVSNTGAVTGWSGKSYQKTTVTTGSSRVKVETYSSWSEGPSFVQCPGGSGTIQQPDATVYAAHPSSNGKGYYKSGNGYQPYSPGIARR